MAIEYHIALEDGKRFAFKVNPERTYVAPATAENWAKLDYCQCSHCPLKTAEHKFCPAAVDIQEVVKTFARLPSANKVKVVVRVPERDYHKNTTLEEALRALMGLMMSTSACPILAKLRPMGVHHLPFGSTDEFIMRSVSFYLLQQYLISKEGGKPDWELKGLMQHNQELQTLNQAFWKRFQTVCQGDSAIKALMGFFSLSSSMSFSMELQIQKLRRRIMGNKPDLNTLINQAKG